MSSKLKKFTEGRGWFNCLIATMAMHPKSKRHEIVQIASEKADLSADILSLQFDRLTMQLEVLRETGSAHISKKGRWVADLPVGQVAFKSGFNHRNATPYLHLWLNGHLIFSQN